MKKYILKVLIVLLVFTNCKKEDNLADQLDKFKLASPINNKLDVTLTVDLDWESPGGETAELPFSNLSVNIAPAYEVFLWEKNTNSLIYHEITSNSSVQVNSLSYSTTYQWKVIAGVDENTYKESEIWEFTTEYKTYLGFIRLASQEEVNDFGKINYGRINGDLQIYSLNSPPITDLTPLSSLQIIDGNFAIMFSDELITIEGFDNLTSVGNNVEITGNHNLTTIKGLNELVSIGGDLLLEAFMNFSSIDAFRNLNYIGGSLRLNMGLTTINEFNKLEFIGSSLIIAFNPNLISINGFINLANIGNDLSIHSNEKLYSIDGFNKMDSIGSKLYIGDNIELVNFGGFGKLSFVGSDIDVSLNSSLTNFCGLQNILQTNGFYGDFSLNFNLVNPTIQEIIDMDCN